jgi:streptomycin 6-kinase
VIEDPPDLSRLVAIATALAREWGLELGAPFALSTWSYVVPAGDEAVLKISLPEDDESLEEGDALELWGGDGAVRVLRHDRARRALLLERARPGTDIRDLPDEEAIAVAVALGRTLWRPAGTPFRWIGDHVPGWMDAAEQRGQAGSELMPLARELYAALEVGRDTLVHGDFHHHNILDAGGRHVAIDTKAMLGEPEYDVPSFLRNPIGMGGLTLERTERRLALFAAAGLDEWKMRAWTVIRCAHLGARPDEAEVLRALV